MFSNKFTVLIGTCDKYQFLWNDFVILFNKYWDNDIDVKKYFISETIRSEIKGFEFLTPGKVPYSECIRYALSHIDTPYVLWLQDDYFLRKTISKEQFESYFKLIENNSLDRFCPNRYRPHAKHYTLRHLFDNYFQMAQNSNYTISMQASIWNVDFFKFCLSNSPETPWQFEIDGSVRLNRSKSHKIFYEITGDSWYIEAMRKGKLTEDYNKIKLEENLLWESIQKE